MFVVKVPDNGQPNFLMVSCRYTVVVLSFSICDSELSGSCAFYCLFCLPCCICQPV